MHSLWRYTHSNAQVSVCVYMLYHALHSKGSNLGHPGQGEHEGLDETVRRTTVSLLITGCSNSGR